MFIHRSVDMIKYQQNQEGSREDIDKSAYVANTDLIDKGTRPRNSNTYHYKESTLPSARE